MFDSGRDNPGRRGNLEKIEKYAIADGRVVTKARIRGERSGASYDWECACLPEAGHDHSEILEMLAENLDARDDVIDDFNALVGEKGDVDGVVTEITDCNIQIHGPMSWKLFVQWKEGVGGAVFFRQFAKSYQSPTEVMDPLDVLELILASAQKTADKYNAAVAAADRLGV